MRKYELHTIKCLADNIIHCGDYGETYVKNDFTSIMIVLGDADDPDLEDIEKYCKSIGIKYEVEAERGPNLDHYSLLSYGIEAENFEGYDLEDGEINPKPLDLNEYSKYLNMLRRLKGE